MREYHNKLREDLGRYRGCVPRESFVCEGVDHLFLEVMTPFILVSICLTYCGVPMLGAYIFIVVISSSWIDPLKIM